MAFEAGQRWELLVAQGKQEFDPIGVRHGLVAGAIGTVREVVDATEPGAHDTSEDAVVLIFEDVQHGIGPDGTRISTPVTRAVSFGVSAFDATNPEHIFKEAL